MYGFLLKKSQNVRHKEHLSGSWGHFERFQRVLGPIRGVPGALRESESFKGFQGVSRAICGVSQRIFEDLRRLKKGFMGFKSVSGIPWIIQGVSNYFRVFFLALLCTFLRISVVLVLNHIKRVEYVVEFWISGNDSWNAWKHHSLQLNVWCYSS